MKSYGKISTASLGVSYPRQQTRCQHLRGEFLKANTFSSEKVNALEGEIMAPDALEMGRFTHLSMLHWKVISRKVSFPYSFCSCQICLC